MLQVEPTHIGLDIAGIIIEELQPETPIQITNELLGIINQILNKSIGLGHAAIYQISNRILTLIPFKEVIIERIYKNKIVKNMNIYLIHLIDKTHCYCVPLEKIIVKGTWNSRIMECVEL